MQLKQLRILGFKTFAEKTEIDIDEGMTAIVGPNGSGKSNIVDALLWVLGEQNPRLLRGTTSQDMIFSGSDKRKPLGMAEVRLTVDNSDGALPIDFAEVVVTRRVYRSGESQYLINNSPCRLKDIVELFLDTGVGKGAYSFVSQSEIDAVLSAKPEDRRELFEEAAGIKKYRVRKRDALRKLENAEGNLNRVRDILQELEVQRSPLERQALEARRYLLLQERLHEIEIGLLVAELQKADYEIYAARQEETDEQANIARQDADLSTLERTATELSDQLAHIESQVDSTRLTQQIAHTEMDRVESRLALLAERSSSAYKSHDQLIIDLREIAERIGALADSIAFDRADREEVDLTESERREEWAGHKAALAELEKAVNDAVRQAQLRQTERLRLAQERATRETALKAATERLAETSARLERVSAEALDLAKSLKEAVGRESETRASHASLSAHRDRLIIAENSADTAHQQYRSDMVAGRNSLDSSRRLQAEQSARLQTLKELQENHEGFYQGVRAVLNAHKRGQIEGNFVPVVDLITVPEQYRVAIEVALGGSLQDIVTHTESEAKGGIEWLKRNRAGRATFLPLPLLRPGQRTDVPRALAQQVQNAADIVGYAPEYGIVAELLLGRVLVVDDMDQAISVSRRLTGWSRIVTLEGEVLSPGGALSGGSLQGRGAHLVGRKGEIDDLNSHLPTTRNEVERLTAQLDSIGRDLQKCEEERQSLARERSANRAELATMEAAVSAAEREKNRITRELADREQTVGQLTAHRTSLQTEADRLAGALESGRIENDLTDTALASLNDETRELVTRRDEKRSRAVALEVEVSRLKEKREGLTRSIANDRATLAAMELQHEQKTRQLNATSSEGVEAAEEHERLAATIEDHRALILEADSAFVLWRNRKQLHGTQSAQIAARIREAAHLRTVATQNQHEAALKIARLEIQISQSTERLQEEYNISRQEAMARPDDTTIDKNTAMEVGRLRRELRGMGQVNTGAVAEFERLTERYEFLSAQKADLEAGKDSLLATIAEIDESTRGVFMETFEAVKVEFQNIFTRLFAGGTTRLVLTDPEDLLETGIEVIAQPPGKKPTQLSLLSGGERALTATALLFAFLAVKPSPFVILDEVDAPLDGANVDKFTSLIKDFSQRSQFLLITHNPVTMEAAPTWYGVTMREAGISSIISYRVPQESTETVHDSTVVLNG